MGNKRIQDLPSKGTTIAANDILEVSEYQSPGVYTSKKILGSELGGVTSFEDLTDTFTFAGNELETVRVNAAGTALETYTPATSSTGRFGIADSSGVYTYYTTLTLAMTAATSGQTIEFFTDYTETGAVTITLKDGVNINGNGHTYTLNVAGVPNAFKVAASATVTCSIFNLTVVRAGSTSVISEGNCLYVDINSTSALTLTGSIFKNTGSGSATCLGGLSTKIIGGDFIAASDAIYSDTSGVKIYNVTATASSSGNGIKLQNGGSVYSSIGNAIGTGYGIYSLSTYEIVNSVGISVSGTGIFGGNMSNCTGLSVSGQGIQGTSGSVITNCTGRSVSGMGIALVSCTAYNTVGISSSYYGGVLASVTNTISNCVFISTTNSAMWNMNGTQAKLNKCTIKTSYSNSAGYGLRGNGGTLPAEIHNCKFDLTGGLARYIHNDSIAANVELVGNIYKGGTVLDPAIVQTAVATEDAQGNIFL